MKFEIHSHEGAGPIRFGMTTSEVREAVGVEFESFAKHPDSHPIDILDDAGCHVYYDESGKMEAVEFMEPGYVTLGGVDLLSLSFAEMLNFVKARDPEVKVNMDGFKSLNLGIGSYSPGGQDEPESPGETLIVFTRGYYDKPAE